MTWNIEILTVDQTFQIFPPFILDDMVTFAQGGEATAAVDMVASTLVNIRKELRFSCLLKPYLVLLDAVVQKGRKTWKTLVENASVTQDLPPAWRLKVMGIDERSPFSRHYGCLVGEYNSTGVCVGLPKRIDRPVYSHPEMRDDAGGKVLFGDSTHDVRKKTDGDVCSKYFDTYVICRIFWKVEKLISPLQMACRCRSDWWYSRDVVSSWHLSRLSHHAHG